MVNLVRPQFAQFATLVESKRELYKKARNLEDTNTALNVLIKKRDKDKAAVEEKVSANIRDLVLPPLEKVMRGDLEAGQKALVEVALLNLKEVTSEFSLNLSSRFYSLSPMEVKVANLIKHGKSTREIGKLLNISPQTTKNHRMRIREKVDIKNKKINLQAFLSSIS